MIEILKKDSYHIKCSPDGINREFIEGKCSCDLENIQHFLLIDDYEKDIQDADAYLVHYITSGQPQKTMNPPKDDPYNTFYHVRTVDADEYIVVHKYPCEDYEASDYMKKNSIGWIREDGEYVIHRMGRKAS